MMGIRQVFELFSDVWHLYRKYAASDLGEKDLDGFTAEAGKISRKYGREPMAKELTMTVVHEIDRIERAKHPAGEEKRDEHRNDDQKSAAGRSGSQG